MANAVLQPAARACGEMEASLRAAPLSHEVLRTDKYDHIVCDDMFKLLVWDCYAWSAWQFFQVKRPQGKLS